MIFVFKCFSWLPLWLAQGIGALLGWFVFAASPTYRGRFLANSKLAGYKFSEVKGAIASSGRLVAELPKLWMSTAGKVQGKAEAPFTWRGREHIEAAYATGKGVIFLTPHLGSFEMIGQAWGQDFGSKFGNFTVLFRPARKAWMAELVANSRNRPGLATVPTNLSGVRQMIKALRKGEAVGLLPDQVPPDGMGLWTPFFGKSAYTMTLAARLSAQTGATVLVGFASAMMDDGRLPAPAAFNPARLNHEYIHFGHGLHECFGRHINDATLHLMLKPLLQRHGLRRVVGPAGHLTKAGIFADRLMVRFDTETDQDRISPD